MGMAMMTLGSALVASAMAMADAPKSTGSKPMVLPDFSAVSTPALPKTAVKIGVTSEGCNDSTQHKLNAGDMGYETCVANPRKAPTTTKQ